MVSRLLSWLGGWLANNWGNVASVIGLIITAINARQIKDLRERLQKRYTLIGRLPQINDRLREHCQIINDCLVDFALNKHAAKLELDRAAVTLKQIQSTLPETVPAPEIESVLQKMMAYQNGNASKLRQIYTDLTVVVDTIAYRVEDATWKSQ